ncbi:MULTISPECIES: major capsid protein [unclassified Oceanicaulis]|uniref:major capsid protein n=1 Tax=unclassified Oceanicaulis TaxID=2632123 RepID=UPI0025DF2CDE|nr:MULTISPECIES: major capsid protein [unclassified Oceanicaulis]
MPKFNFPYSARSMTMEVRKHPLRYGLVSSLNIFPLEPIDSTFVQVTEDNGVLQVLAAKERGAPGQKSDNGRQNLKIFQVPHFPVEDQILASDLQDRMIVVEGREVRANLPMELAKKQRTIARKHAITAEYLRVQALKGIIKDGDGTTLSNLYTDFGVSQHVVYFDLDNEEADIRGADEALRGYIEDNLLGETLAEVEVLVSPEFFGKFVEHPKVKALYEAQDKRELRDLPRYTEAGATGRMFNPFGPVTYVEYRGSAPTKSGSERFIAAGEGHAYPVGTSETFATFAAPADTLSELNDLPTIIDMDLGDNAGRFALPIFMSAELMKHGKGVELWSESNFLPLCKQPKVLVKVSASADPG